MAVTATASSLVRVAQGTVWKQWLDLEGWPRWQPEAVAARWTAGEPWAAGSAFSLARRGPFPLLHRLPGLDARRFGGRVLSTSHEQLLVWELQPTRGGWFGPVVVESVRLEPAPVGTTVTLTLTAHGLGPTLLGPFLRSPLRAQAEATLAGLRQALAPVERRL